MYQFCEDLKFGVSFMMECTLVRQRHICYPIHHIMGRYKKMSECLMKGRALVPHQLYMWCLLQQIEQSRTSTSLVSEVKKKFSFSMFFEFHNNLMFIGTNLWPSALFIWRFVIYNFTNFEYFKRVFTKEEFF